MSLVLSGGPGFPGRPGLNGCGSRASHLRSSASIWRRPKPSQIALQAAVIIDRGEAVIQRPEADAGLGRPDACAHSLPLMHSLAL